MPYRRPTPAPADFAACCETMCMRQLRQHFGCGVATIRHWCRQTGSTPAAPYNAAKEIPRDFLLHAASETVEQLQGRYDTSRETIARWRRATGCARKVMPTKPKLPMPNGFAEVSATMSRSDLCARYGVCRAVITRWRHEAGVVGPPRVRSLEPAAPVKRSAPHRYRLSPMPQADASLAGQAQQHLQKTMPVFKASVLGRGRSGYVVGGRQMATEDMIAMAQAKGFDPRAWARI